MVTKIERPMTTPTKADIEAALRGTPYEGAENVSAYSHNTSEADFDASNEAIVNAARALEFERALVKMVMIDFNSTKSIAEAFGNARATLTKWGQL